MSCSLCPTLTRWLSPKPKPWTATWPKTWPGLRHPPVRTVRKPIWLHECKAAWRHQRTVGDSNWQCHCVAAPRREHWDVAQGAVKLATIKSFSFWGLFGGEADKQHDNRTWSKFMKYGERSKVLLCCDEPNTMSLWVCLVTCPAAYFCLFHPSHLGQYLFILDDVLVCGE